MATHDGHFLNLICEDKLADVHNRLVASTHHHGRSASLLSTLRVILSSPCLPGSLLLCSETIDDLQAERDSVVLFLVHSVQQLGPLPAWLPLVLPRVHRCLLVLMMRNTPSGTLFLVYAATIRLGRTSKIFLLKKNWEEWLYLAALHWIFDVITGVFSRS